MQIAGRAEEQRPLSDADFARLQDWSKRYRFERRNGGESLRFIGREMFDWLNGAQSWLTRDIDEANGGLCFEFRVKPHPDEWACTFLNAPWELLASKTDFLAANALHPLIVYRRLASGSGMASAPPEYLDIAALFMAAAVDGQVDLDHEDEEIALLEATRNMQQGGLDLAVEDSGALATFAARLKLEWPLEIVHLSCHGDLNEQGGCLIFEDDYGKADKVGAIRLMKDGFGQGLPRLLFLSACHSAEGSADAKVGAALPLSLALIEAGFPALLGWGGPVRDAEATDFARELYSQLLRGRTIKAATAYARHALLQAKARDWHLARLYLHAKGGGPVCRAGTKSRPRKHLADHGHQDILHTRQAAGGPAGQARPVASRQGFVGRRRETQSILRLFRDNGKAGVLIHGQGRLGKTSLAARIANRRSDLKPVVIYGGYRAIDIFGEMLKACAPEEQLAFEQRWQTAVAEKPANLRLALEAMLTGPLNIDMPVLLIIDDLEQALDEPSLGQETTAVKSEFVESLQAVIEAFEHTLGRTQTRLLFTSRYRFTLPDAKGRDLSQSLHALQLAPMQPRERRKQMQARLRIEGKAADALNQTLQGRCIAAAVGNAGLQDMLTSAVLQDAAAAGQALAAIERYLADGTRPQEEKTAEFLENLLLETLLEAVDDDGRALLRAATVFALPMPMPVIEAAAKAVGVAGTARHISRLAGLSLIDPVIANRETGETYWLVNRLVRPALLAEVTGEAAGPPITPVLPEFDPGPVALSPGDQAQVLAAILPLLEKAWRRSDRDIAIAPQALELMRLAALAQNWPLMGEAAAAGALWLQGNHHPHDAERMTDAALKLLDDRKIWPPARLLTICSRLAAQFGHGEKALSALERGLAANGGGLAQATLWCDWGGLQAQRGNAAEALKWLEKAKTEFERLGNPHSHAVTMGKIADILVRRGDLDQALRIYKDELLPVYERLGDVRSRAVTMGKIADILVSRGDLDEALRIRQQEQLPVYEKLKDMDGLINVLWSCSRIRMAKGIGDQETFDRIMSDLSQAYRLARQLTRLDAICAVASDLGQLLAMVGAKAEARPLLIEARDGFTKLQQGQIAARIDEMLKQMDDDAEQQAMQEDMRDG
jgi:tetratricopeptide (TPR) repeat protein